MAKISFPKSKPMEKMAGKATFDTLSKKTGALKMPKRVKAAGNKKLPAVKDFSSKMMAAGSFSNVAKKYDKKSFLKKRLGAF